LIIQGGFSFQKDSVIDLGSLNPLICKYLECYGPTGSREFSKDFRFTMCSCRSFSHMTYCFLYSKGTATGGGASKQPFVTSLNQLRKILLPTVNLFGIKIALE
jgi:hypothetical protein